VTPKNSGSFPTVGEIINLGNFLFQHFFLQHQPNQLDLLDSRNRTEAFIDVVSTEPTKHDQLDQLRTNGVVGQKLS
jgi:hypothetical protein